MPLAALYGLRGAHALPLDIPTMRAFHGTALALGFGLAGLLGWTVSGTDHPLTDVHDPRRDAP